MAQKKGGLSSRASSKPSRKSRRSMPAPVRKSSANAAVPPAARPNHLSLLYAVSFMPLPSPAVSWLSRRGLRPPCPDIRPVWLVLFQILLEEVVQERTNDADGCELPDIRPGGRDRCSHNVSGQLKFKPQQQPNPKAQPDVF